MITSATAIVQLYWLFESSLLSLYWTVEGDTHGLPRQQHWPPLQVNWSAHCITRPPL